MGQIDERSQSLPPPTQWRRSEREAHIAAHAAAALKKLRVIARVYAHRTGYDVDVLEEVAAEGLLKAIALFDLDRALNFSSYAAQQMQYAIMDVLRGRTDRWHKRRLRYARQGAQKRASRRPLQPPDFVAAVEWASELAHVQWLVAQFGRPVDAENFAALRHLSQHELAQQRGVTASAISHSVRNMRQVVATWQRAAEKATHGAGDYPQI